MKRVSETNCGLNNFAKNLVKDYEAINNAVITRYSNGQVEGQVNRIKNNRIIKNLISKLFG